MSTEFLNPYTANLPPEEVPSGEMPKGAEVKLFSAFSVGLATFLGSMIAGSILMGINYRRMGRSGEAIAVVLAGVLATATYIACILLFFPDWIPNLLHAGFQALMAWSVFQQLQGRIVRAHQLAGGGNASSWWGVLVAVLVSVPLFGTLLGVDAAIRLSLGKCIPVDGDEVYISGGATEADGRWLAGQLKEAGWFEGNGAAAALHRSRDRYTVSLFVANDSAKDQETIQFVTDLGSHLAEQRLGHPVEMRLLDENQRVLNRILIP